MLTIVCSPRSICDTVTHCDRASLDCRPLFCIVRCQQAVRGAFLEPAQSVRRRERERRQAAKLQTRWLCGLGFDSNSSFVCGSGSGCLLPGHLLPSWHSICLAAGSCLNNKMFFIIQFSCFNLRVNRLFAYWHIIIVFAAKMVRSSGGCVGVSATSRYPRVRWGSMGIASHCLTLLRLVYMPQVSVLPQLITCCAENRCKPNEHFHFRRWLSVWVDAD